MARKRIVHWTVVIWFVVALISLSLRGWLVLSGPPSGDTYANTLEFQVFASLYLFAVFWCSILAGTLTLEFIGFFVGDWLRLRRASRRAVLA